MIPFLVLKHQQQYLLMHVNKIHDATIEDHSEVVILMSILANIHHGESMGGNGRFTSRHHSYGMVHIGGKVFLRKVVP